MTKTTEMNFIEAVKIAAETGCKIKRPAWHKNSLVFNCDGMLRCADGDSFSNYKEHLLADDWEVVNEKIETMEWPAALSLLKEGKLVRRLAWPSTAKLKLTQGNSNTYRFYRWESGHSIPWQYYSFSLEDFEADDWVEVLEDNA